MFSLLLLWMGALIRLFRSRGNLVLENLVLRQQLAVLKRRHRRPSIGPLDKLFWVVVRRFWSGWKQALNYHEDRTHLGLGKGTPNGRIRSLASGWVLSQERSGGLQHR